MQQVALKGLIQFLYTFYLKFSLHYSSHNLQEAYLTFLLYLLLSNRRHVCEYQREEIQRKRVPTVRPYTTQVKVLKPDCTPSPTEDCLDYERR